MVGLIIAVTLLLVGVAITRRTGHSMPYPHRMICEDARRMRAELSAATSRDETAPRSTPNEPPSSDGHETPAPDDCRTSTHCGHPSS